MTEPDIHAENLLELLVERIRREFYPHWHEDRFYKLAFTISRELLRFGFECHRNGWEFSARELFDEITDLLERIKKHKADIEYFPAYLKGAINSHLMQKAEHYASRQHVIDNIVAKLIAGAQTQKIEDRSICGAWAIAYNQATIASRRSKAVGKQATKLKQKEMKL